MNDKQTEDKIKLFLAIREKTYKRLKLIEEKFKDEKENEEAWPGHESNFIQQVEEEYVLVLAQLKKNDEILKKLGYQSQNQPQQNGKGKNGKT